MRKSVCTSVMLLISICSVFLASVSQANGLCNVTSPTELLPCTDVSGERFGYSASLDSNQAVVGAIFADDGATGNAGAAYVFLQQNGLWSHTASLAAGVVQQNSYFGWSSSISGNLIAVGAPGTGSMLGYTYLFENDQTGWK